TYLLSNDFMLDVSGGFGLTDNAPDYFMALGFSFRI
ncbi:MAG: transporter, partial [Flavobacterium sp.]|nr:transporter [Flavobacterium sp.]